MIIHKHTVTSIGAFIERCEKYAETMGLDNPDIAGHVKFEGVSINHVHENKYSISAGFDTENELKVHLMSQKKGWGGFPKDYGTNYAVESIVDGLRLLDMLIRKDLMLDMGSDNDKI